MHGSSNSRKSSLHSQDYDIIGISSILNSASLDKLFFFLSLQGFCPKVADFGLVELCNMDITHLLMTGCGRGRNSRRGRLMMFEWLARLRRRIKRRSKDLRSRWLLLRENREIKVYAWVPWFKTSIEPWAEFVVFSVLKCNHPGIITC